jgi:hypothetical protein
MAAGATYVPITTTTLTGSTGSLTISSIPSTYTDLILVGNAKTASLGNFYIQLGHNGTIDTGNNYSYTTLVGNGSSVSSYRTSNNNDVSVGDFGAGTEYTTVIVNFFNYANTNVYKSFLSRSALASTQVVTRSLLWRSTNTITDIYIFGDSGSLTGTFTLYGISAA